MRHRDRRDPADVRKATDEPSKKRAGIQSLPGLHPAERLERKAAFSVSAPDLLDWANQPELLAESWKPRTDSLRKHEPSVEASIAARAEALSPARVREQRLGSRTGKARSSPSPLR